MAGALVDTIRKLRRRNTFDGGRGDTLYHTKYGVIGEALHMIYAA